MNFKGAHAIYNDFAYLYDNLMNDVNYGKWADYIEGIFHENKLSPRMILDLGCGTGSMCIEMAKRGYEMIGIDNSVDMLTCAKNKAVDEGVDILFLHQDMTSFELYGTVDVVLCLMDSVNYVTDPKGIKNIFKLVHNYLNHGGLFIFDINSYYKFEQILADNVFYSIDDDVSYIWQNHFNKKENVCQFDLTFFVSNQDGLYERYDEIHVEKAYKHEDIAGFIDMSRLKLISCYGELSYDKPHETSERIFYICRKD